MPADAGCAGHCIACIADIGDLDDPADDDRLILHALRTALPVHPPCLAQSVRRFALRRAMIWGDGLSRLHEASFFSPRLAANWIRAANVLASQPNTALARL